MQVLIASTGSSFDSELAFVENVSVTQYLIASLVSAVAIKFSLCRYNALFHAIHSGLYYHQYRFDPATRQVSVLGACLQLGRISAAQMSTVVGASCFHPDRDTHNLVR